MPRQFLIVTQADDIHGLAVQAAVRRRSLRCHTIESDQLHSRESINFAIGAGESGAAYFRTSEGELFDASQIEAIWWRRYKAAQLIDSEGLTDAHRSLINNDCHGALVGSLQNSFQGKWISSPRATEYASNKLNQLAAAKRNGMTIPETLVTQSPAAVREFCQRKPEGVIVKPVVGTAGPLLFTRLIGELQLQAEDSIRACPAIYQEYVPGTKHIRLNCFGRQSFAGLIESEQLDWRPDLNVPVSRWPVPESLHRKLRAVLDDLGLDMGIIDLKQTPTGEFVFLEVNPQGQFLFLEGLTGEPLTEHFADYFTSGE